MIVSYSSHEFLINVLVSAGLVALAMLLRAALARTIPATGSLDERRRRLVGIRNTLVLVVLAGLAIIWASELRTLAVSLVAIAVALVIATREPILCAIGALARASRQLYGVGDRIEIKGIRGDVIDVGLLYTSVMEVGPGPSTQQYSGRVVSFPNSVMLTDSVVVETFTGEYTVHNIAIPLPREADWESEEARLLEIAQDVCAPFLAEAKHHMEELQTHYSLDLPSPEPRTLLQLTHEKGEPVIGLLLRVPILTRSRAATEQAILRRYLKKA